jgi:hypothetical protein
VRHGSRRLRRDDVIVGHLRAIARHIIHVNTMMRTKKVRTLPEWSWRSVSARGLGGHNAATCGRLPTPVCLELWLPRVGGPRPVLVRVGGILPARVRRPSLRPSHLSASRQVARTRARKRCARPVLLVLEALINECRRKKMGGRARQLARHPARQPLPLRLEPLSPLEGREAGASPK